MKTFDLTGKRVFVAGHRGLVGSAIMRRLVQESCTVFTAPRAELDLTQQELVQQWLKEYRPDALFFAAAKVGGILANSSYPADFIYDNLVIEMNLIHAAYLAGVKRLVFLGSSCIYPKLAPQPIKEEALLTGLLEPTNEWYAIAKIAGIKLCEAYRRQYGCDFVSAMPTNLYGPGDNFDLTTSHVLPALIRKMHDAKMAKQEQVVLWGTGAPLREFLHVDDCADALVHIIKFYSENAHINVGCGEELSISQLARLTADVVRYEGKIVYDASKPDGTPRKLMDSSRLRALGWTPKIGLREGIEATYQWYLDHQDLARH